MRATKITYYISTGLISFAMLFLSYSYLNNPQLKLAFQHLGFPDYFRIELAIAKLLAAIALWVPIRLIKGSAYIGLAITFVSAIIAHIVLKDDTFHTISPLVILVILIISYLTSHKLSKGVIGKP